MASQYVLRKSGAGWNVFIRDLVSHGEYRRRFEYMTQQCGINPDEAALDLYELQKFYKKNERPASWPLIESYVFDTIDPGDIIQIESSWFVVNKPAKMIA